MQHNIGKKVLEIVSKIINYIKTHEEGFVVPWGRRSRYIAGRNQLVDFSNLIGRGDTRIKVIGPPHSHNGGLEWRHTFDADEEKTSGISEIIVHTWNHSGKVIAEVKLSDQYHSFLEDNDPSHFKHNMHDVHDWTIELKYEGETPEEVIDKMTQDCLIIPPPKKLVSPANRNRRANLNVAMEAVIQRLVVEGVLPEERARDEYWGPSNPVTEEEAQEVLNNQNKWNEMVTRVRQNLRLT